MKKNIYYLFSIAETLFLETSKELLKEGIDAAFFGLAVGKSDTLANPIFSKITYLSDVVNHQVSEFTIDFDFLKEVEEKYDIVIANLIHSDRHLMRFDSKKRLFFAQKIIKSIIKDIQENNISTVMSYSLAGFPSYFTSKYCKVEGIPFSYYIAARLGTNFFFSDRTDTGTFNFEKKLLKNKLLLQNNEHEVKKIEIFVKDYVSAKKQPGYVNAISMKYKAISFRDIKVFFSYLFAYFKDSNGFNLDKNPLLLPFYRMQRIYRKKNYMKVINTKLSTLANLADKKYFIYPLHFHPEAATLIQGRWINNQVEIIEMISKALPVDTILVVKEHRVSIGRRPPSFFQAIANFHNVTFVHENIDVYELMKQSKGIATISSSMGLEALMILKPVISFGDIFYNYSNNTYLARDFSQLSKLFQKALQHKFDKIDMLALLKTHTDEIIDVGNDTPVSFSSFLPTVFAKKIKDAIKD